MEGSQAAQQPQPPSARRWLEFAEWLRQQAGGAAEETVSEASASDAEETDLPLTEPGAGAAFSAASSSRGGSVLTPRGAAPTLPSPGQLARHATLAPRLPDCRAETRLTSESCSRARQEMTVLLAAPGMPLHQAPVLTAKQASALMTAICEPLLSLPVGRLTRKLSAPTKLQPTPDRGQLSLWLLPDDSLSLVWQSAVQLPPAELAAATASGISDAASSTSDAASSRSDSGSIASSSCSSAAQVPELQQSCNVAVWEELAHFPAQAHLQDEAPVVTIHMLRGDATGRSFYIRVRGDVAEANLEAATAAVPDAARMLPQQRACSSGREQADAMGAPRMYFWLTDRDLGRAVYSLGRLKSLLKRPPTLAKRSGVPERQLAQLGAWVARADALAAEQQRQAAAAAQQQLEQQQQEQQQQQQQQEECDEQAWTEPGALMAGAAGPAAGGGASTPVHRSAPAGLRSSLTPLLQAPTAGLLLGHTNMAAAAQALLPGAGGHAATTGGSESGPVACGTSTVSATAAAVYQDQRFNLVCPCTISVVVGMKVQAAGGDPSLLPAEASTRARSVAEVQAKSAVDRSGRQRIEERLAEMVIRNIRAQRNKARAARQQQRDAASRAAAAERALALARQASGRATPGSPTAAPPASPAQDDHQLAAANWMPSCSSSSSSRMGGQAAPSLPGAAAAHALPAGGSGTSSTIGEVGSRHSSSAFSAAAAVPLPPGGRVTIENLHSLLSPPAPQGGELRGPAPAAPAAGEASQLSPGTSLSIADLADLFGKQKLE